MKVTDLFKGQLLKTRQGTGFSVYEESWVLSVTPGIVNIPVARVVKEYVNCPKSGVYLGRKVSDLKLLGTMVHYQVLIRGRVCKILGTDFRFIEAINEEETNDETRCAT